MAMYEFTLTLRYQVEGESEGDAINAISDIIRQDWPYYIDEGELYPLIESEESKC